MKNHVKNNVRAFSVCERAQSGDWFERREEPTGAAEDISWHGQP